MDIGGTQHHLLEVLRLLNRDIFEPHLCCLVRLGDLKDKLYKLGIEPKVFNIRRIYGFSGIKGTISLIKYIKKEEFDIVHTYLFLANLAGNLAAKIAGVPVIISGRRDTGAPNEGKWYHNIAYRIAHSLASKVICVSNAVADVVRQKEGVKDEKITVVQNGIDLSKIYNSEYSGLRKADIGIKEDDFVVNMTASFSWVKNHQFLLDAVPEIIKRNPKIKFLLVGDGELKLDMQSKVKSLDLENNIIFLGKRMDSQDLLKISNIALNLSFSEGSSNVILEAMALGKPVIATDIKGNRELVLNRITGYLVPLRDTKHLTECIVSLSNSIKQCNAMGEKAIGYAHTYFRLEDKIDELQSLYASLVARYIPLDIHTSNKKLKIAFLLTDALKVAGAQRNIISLSKYLLTQGHEVFIACRKGVLAEGMEQTGIKYIEYDFHFKGIKSFIDCVRALREMIVRYDFDIIAPQSIRTALVASRALKNLSTQTRPLIIANIYNIGSKFYSFLAPLILNNSCNYVIFESNYERNRLLNRGLNENKSIVIHTGIDLTRFKPQDKDITYASQYGLNNGNIVVGTVARLSPEKDITSLIRALAMLKDKDRVKLMIVGDGILRGSFEKMVSNMNLQDKVIFAGMQKDTGKFISLLDIFVLPSLRESFSMAAREAMAMAKPVILTDVGGAGEILEDGLSGFLVPAGRPDILAKKIKQLIENKELRLNLGINAQARAEKFFNQDNWFRKIEDIYTSTAKNFALQGESVHNHA